MTSAARPRGLLAIQLAPLRTTPSPPHYLQQSPNSKYLRRGDSLVLRLAARSNVDLILDLSQRVSIKPSDIVLTI